MTIKPSAPPGPAPASAAARRPGRDHPTVKTNFDAVGYRAAVMLSIAATLAVARGATTPCSTIGGRCPDVDKLTGPPLCMRCALLTARIAYAATGVGDPAALLTEAVTVATMAAEAAGVHQIAPATSGPFAGRLYGSEIAGPLRNLARDLYDRSLPDDVLHVTIPLVLNLDERPA